VRDNELRLFVDFGIMPQETNPPQLSNRLFNEALSQQQALPQQANSEQTNSVLAQYQKLLDLGPGQLSAAQAAVIYHNMAGLAYKSGDYVKAYVWEKKAISLAPGHGEMQQALAQYQQKFSPPHITQQISGWEQLQININQLPTDAWLSLSLILILVTGGVFLKRLLNHKKIQVRDQLSLPFWTLQQWPIYSLLFVTLISVSFSWLAVSYASIPRALVIAEKADIQTAPGADKPVIYQAQAGLELQLLRSEEGYFQVRYPGAFSGWVAKAQIEPLSLFFGQK
jgi:hypothetical protein